MNNRIVKSVVPQAIKDAQRGDTKAIQFLDVCCPTWRDEHLPVAPTVRKRSRGGSLRETNPLSHLLRI